jgi:glycosyltransferase involved in cell wall biosynthesis
MPDDAAVPDSMGSDGTDAAPPTVAIVITTFNHAHFLGDAIASALAQTRPADEVIVVDDGSTDDPAAVVRGFARVRLIRQNNQGLSAARNTGLFAAQAEMIVFLDADDRLLPEALAAGLACHRQSGPCGLVYGGHRYISREGTPFGAPRYTAIGQHGHIDLLGGNLIGMHATVMYRRDVLAQLGGFDITLRRCEDYDVYLRLAKQFSIASHSTVVAEYRKHGTNMSADHLEMLRWVLRVQAKAAPPPRDAAVERAWRNGQAIWRAYYAEQILDEARSAEGFATRLAAVARAWQASPRTVARRTAGRLLHGGKRWLPPPTAAWLHRIRRGRPAPGHVRFGDLARTDPIDDNFGYGRGTPLDRFYVESFLEKHRDAIAGRVLEAGDAAYSRRFGGARITHQDVLHVHADNPDATIVGDLAMPDVLPRDSFDCIVLTQTLQFIYDMRAAIAHLYTALKPGGVLLLTVPGLSQVDRYVWGETWYWAVTPAAASRLFAEQFPAGCFTVECHGNVFAATAFLHGLALEEVPRAKLLVHDPAYPLIVTVRARKPPAGETER